MSPLPQLSAPFPYTSLFRSNATYRTKSWYSSVRHPCVLQLVDIRDYHEIALGHHRHDLRLHLLRYWYGLHPPDLGEVLHHTSASGRRVRVMLDVPLGQVSVGQLPVSRLKQIFDDVVGNLLVGIEARVAAVEQRVRIARADNRFLCLQ